LSDSTYIRTAARFYKTSTLAKHSLHVVAKERMLAATKNSDESSITVANSASWDAVGLLAP